MSSKPNIPGRPAGQEQANFITGEIVTAEKINAIYNFFLEKVNTDDFDGNFRIRLEIGKIQYRYGDTGAWIDVVDLGSVLDGLTIADIEGLETALNERVTNAKLVDVTAPVIKGRITAGAGIVEDLTPAQARTLINVADGATANASDAALRDRSTHTGVQAISTVSGLQAELDGKELVSRKVNDLGTPSNVNYPTVDAVNAAIAGVSAGELYQGDWDAATNNPVLTSSVGTEGNYYRVTVEGTTTLDGISSWSVGDNALFRNGVWIRRPNIVVTSVNTRIGDIVLDKSDVGLANVDNTSDADKPISTSTQAALDTKMESSDIADFETSSQLNTRDANNRARANHTGTQLASTISDFDASVASNSAVAANTAKVTNATHTGDVVGATDLTIANDVVNNAKLANMSNATIKGRFTAGAGDPEDLTAEEVRSIINVADGATANASNSELRDRTTHTGEQAISTVTGLQTALDGKAASVHTHTSGDVTDFDDGVISVITTEVLQPNEDQFPIINNEYVLGSKFLRPSTSIINFRTSGQRLNPANPIYDSFTITPEYLVWQNVGNLWDVFISGASDPFSTPPSYMTVTGTFLVGYANLNRCTFLLDQVYNATTDEFELKVLVNITQAEGANADPEAPSGQLFDDIVLRLDFEDTMSPVPSTLVDSGPNGLTVNLTNEAGDLSSVAGVSGQAIKRGVLDAYSGARLTIPYNAAMASINQTSGLYMGMWLKLSSTTTSKRMRLISTASAWDGSGWRIDSNDTGQISLYLAPTTVSDSSPNVRLITSVPNGFLYDDTLHFYEFSYDPVAKTAYIHRDRVLMASAVIENVDTTAKDLTADDEWRIFHTSSGASSICEADTLIIASRFITTEERQAHFDLN